MEEKRDRDRTGKLRKGLSALKGAQRTEAAAGRYMHLGATLAASTLLFLYGGYRLDGWIGTLPLFTLIGTFVGGFGGFVYLYRELTAGERRRKREGNGGRR
ncbi:MAG: AtpZ/AtpI family protein [Candidatus Eisenbacteria bacterium]|nr:AtpZ/AtpI family protein [Candidatus Eisenbacteria bacterium]